ncbi:hypothetical protein H072_1912 [Dactylellina haptotyla CBS 200.50]|uniref:Uncharacterized protein n=1 Tax=Dactylellina haptotyla (strain CBS 200.50) TaxID=1284197 RepID=S8ASS7_DACHA|nr:hypothetical protein H072_1912 [Dactylellina haptotyla CBS 200.50]
MSFPLDKFPASELPARLAAHTTSTTSSSPYGGKSTKVTNDPITLEKLEKECVLERIMQYDCQVVRMLSGTGLDLGDAGVNCWEIERRFWRCPGGRTVEGTAMQRAWGDGGDSRRRSMELVRQRQEYQEQKAAEREKRRMERELKEILLSGDRFW